MLQNTFIHLPGITEAKERKLWSQGIWHWDDLERAYPEIGGPAQATLFPEFQSAGSGKEGLKRAIEASYKAFDDGDTGYFAVRLESRNHYRIALSFPCQTAFLDIETTGLSHYYDVTTLVGASMNGEYQPFVRETPDDRFREFIAAAKCIVTFNGTIFDLRFLRNEYPQFVLPSAHVDLRFLCKRVGLTGGQKAIESQIGVERPSSIETIVGEKAPTLWHEYRLGDLESLKALIKYNHADVEGMRFIFDAALERLVGGNDPLPELVTVPEFSKTLSTIKWAAKRESQKKNCVYVSRYRGKKGPLITYRDLVSDEYSKSLRIVGIDLTGSEARPTGWCLLDGNRAQTRQISSNKDLIEMTLAAKPDIVSIDSPLSLPKGRKRVTDDDPGRDQYGIMRECERTLKKRGVNVYPSLIPSMQRLTERGIMLAGELRKLGLPVIESYPGAAQDIINIPRKRAGLEYLVKGLADFGVKGEFTSQQVSHDELDAITSAIVGVFFWAGKFEGLGNEVEEYLIIPDLHASRWNGKKVVGLSGQICSGKTTGAEFLEKLGFDSDRFSLVLRKLQEARGKPTDRASLQKYGEKIHKFPGQRWLGKKLFEGKSDSSLLVVDGLRFREDFSLMVETFGPAFLHVHIAASSEIRGERYVRLGHTIEDFKVASAHPVEQEITALSEYADEVIHNDKSKRAFTSKLKEVIRIK